MGWGAGLHKVVELNMRQQSTLATEKAASFQEHGQGSGLCSAVATLL